MVEKHIFKIATEYFQVLANGLKTMEGRIGLPKYTKIKPGEYIIFIDNSDPNRRLTKKVLNVFKYKNYEEALYYHLSKLAPGKSYKEAISIYYSIYPKKKINKYGALIISFE